MGPLFEIAVNNTRPTTIKKKRKEKENHHPPLQTKKKEMLPATTNAHKLTTVTNKYLAARVS